MPRRPRTLAALIRILHRRLAGHPYAPSAAGHVWLPPGVMVMVSTASPVELHVTYPDDGPRLVFQRLVESEHIDNIPHVLDALAVPAALDAPRGGAS